VSQLGDLGIFAVDHLDQLRLLVDHLRTYLVVFPLVDHMGLVGFWYWQLRFSVGVVGDLQIRLELGNVARV
jgi:hypothetical protein